MLRALYAVARVKLGMTPGEFGRTTPRQLDECLEQLRLDRRNFFYGFGIVAATMANIKRDPSRRPEPWKAEDFIPDSLRSRQPAMDLDEQIEALTRIFGCGPKRRPRRR